MKKRKLTPPEMDGRDYLLSTPKVICSNNDFYNQVSSWNLEQDYEVKPRKSKMKGKEYTRLPIKTADGLIQHVETPEDAIKDEQSDLDWLSEPDSEIEVSDTDEEKPIVSLHQQILEAKEELARLALLLNEDPEEHLGAFKRLDQFRQSSNDTVRKLALVTQLAVFKDVIPGYRIRPLSERDMDTKVSKEVRRLRAYEQTLVSNYHTYVIEIGKLAQSEGGLDSQDGGSRIGSIAIMCACTLLTSVPHFNFRGELLNILVRKLSSRNVDDDFVKCREAIETIFREDQDGTPSLDAMTLLTKMMKVKDYRIDESVLNTFLHLRLLSEFSWKASQDHVDKPKNGAEEVQNKKLKEKKLFRTKKQRKILKEQKEIEKEMKQVDAAVSYEERDRMQAETLKLVFATYFRILKIRSPILIGAVLEGLAKYAHLINQDFFGDLLEALRDLICHTEADQVAENDVDIGGEDTITTRNPSREALLCTITAFALLEGQDAAKAQTTLNLDLSFFITHLYQTLHALSLNPDIELNAKSLRLPDPNAPTTSTPSKDNRINLATTTVLLLRSVSSVLLPPHGSRAVPPLRVAAFTKQLLTACLQVPEKSAIATMGLITKLTKTHEKKIAGLWNTEERRGDGKFDPLSAEVEGSNPFASTVWEGEILRKHFCPAVREAVKAMEKNVLGLA
jgi:nucleolar complex protein 3